MVVADPRNGGVARAVYDPLSYISDVFLLYVAEQKSCAVLLFLSPFVADDSVAEAGALTCLNWLVAAACHTLDPHRHSFTVQHVPPQWPSTN